MFKQAPQDNEVRRVMDACLPGLENKPDFDRDVLRQVRGEVKVKKKISVGFVLVIALVLAAVTALAAVLLWEQQVIPMKEIEQSEGDYVDWPISQKQVLIRALIDSGNIVESDETTRLFDDATAEAEKNSIADQLILTLTKLTDVQEISVDMITYAIMGSTDTWTPEQRAWWQQVTEQFYSDQGATDTLITPTNEVVSEAEAVAIARTAILEAYQLPPDALDSSLTVADLFVTEQRPNYRRWNVQFKVLRDGSDSYVKRIYTAIVDEDGQVIDDPDVGIDTPTLSAERSRDIQNRQQLPLFDTISALANSENGMPIWAWSLETKAEYSKVVAPQVRTIVESGNLTPLINGEAVEPDPYVIASSSYTYGLPGNRDMKQADALDLAKRAIMETYSVDNDVVELYDQLFVYFDITNPSVPLWKFVFQPGLGAYEKFPNRINRDEQNSLRYKVEINSQTGEVMSLEEFKFETTDVNREYYLKWF